MRALDLFAGTGWGVACQRLGIEEDGVELMPEAVASREAAGMRTVLRDVRDVLDRLRPGGVFDLYDLHIASPPCQSFSMAGKGAGRKALDAVLAGVERFSSADPAEWPSYEDLAALTGDERTALVLEPLRVALAGLPRLIAWEQVPAVLPVWDACADVLRVAGYSVATGVLQAEAYGVPQTRKRAFLVARRDGREARLPEPTHSRYHSRDPKRLDPGVRPWVSMAEALGWGATERPAMTVTGGGATTGGVEPFGNAARQGLERERERSLAAPLGMRSNYGTGGDPRKRGVRMIDEPAPTVTSKVDRNRWVSPEEAKDLDWPWNRPSPTVVGSFRPDVVAAPGYRRPGDPPRQMTPGSVRVSAEEAAVLQSYPADFPFAGAKGNRFLQIGNAVPPLLAEAVLRALLDMDPPEFAEREREREAVTGSSEVSFCATNVRPNSALRPASHPAPTLAFGHESPRWVAP